MYPFGDIPEQFVLIFAGLIGFFIFLVEGSAFEFQKEVSKYNEKPLKILAGIGSISRLSMLLLFLAYVVFHFFELDERPIIPSNWFMVFLIASMAVSSVIELYLIWKTHDSTSTVL